MKTTLAIIAAIVLTSCNSDQDRESKNSSRFEVVQLGTFRRDQFLLDRKTGQLWGKTCLVPGKGDADCEYIAWMKEEIEDVNISRSTMLEAAKAYREALENKARK